MIDPFPRETITSITHPHHSPSAKRLLMRAIVDDQLIQLRNRDLEVVEQRPQIAEAKVHGARHGLGGVTCDEELLVSRASSLGNAPMFLVCFLGGAGITLKNRG